MKYLCLIYDEEQKLNTLPKTEWEGLMGEFFAFTESIKKRGADLCRRLGRSEEARTAYERALSLTRQEPERRFLERRLQELAGA